MLQEKSEAISKLHDDCETMERELKTARDELNGASQAIEDLTEENQELYAQREALTEESSLQHQDAEEAINELHAKLEELEAVSSNQETVISDQQQQITQLEISSSKLEDINTELKTEIRMLSDSLKVSDQEQTTNEQKYFDRLSKLQDQMKYEKKDKEKIKTEMNKKLEKITGGIQEADKEVRRLILENQNLQESNLKLSTFGRQPERDPSKELVSQIESLQAKLDVSHTENKALRMELESKSLGFEKLKKQGFELFKKEIDILREDMSQKNMKMKLQQETINSLERKHNEEDKGVKQILGQLLTKPENEISALKRALKKSEHCLRQQKRVVKEQREKLD